MICQIINLSNKKTFTFYKDVFNIPDKSYQKDLLGFECRNLNTKDYSTIFKLNLISKYSVFFLQSSLKIILIGCINDFKKFANQFEIYDYPEISLPIKETITKYENYDSCNFMIGNKNFDFKNNFIMGILNVTPDSFSDGGKYLSTEKAVEHGLDLLDEGCDILDIGGESTRPGSDFVSEEEELKRVIPVIKNIIEKEPDAIISIDTTKSKVAEESLKLGAKIVNDISGGKFDNNMMKIVSRYKAVFVIMHIKEIPKTMQHNTEYENMIEDIYDLIDEQVQLANQNGIDKIFIDAGIGFGKKVEHNYEIIDRLDDFKSIGYPVLIGLSRKSFLGNSLNLKIDERDFASSIAEAICIEKGAKIIRTHNVKNAIQVKNIFNFLSS